MLGHFLVHHSPFHLICKHKNQSTLNRVWHSRKKTTLKTFLLDHFGQKISVSSNALLGIFCWFNSKKIHKRMKIFLPCSFMTTLAIIFKFKVLWMTKNKVEAFREHADHTEALRWSWLTLFPHESVWNFSTKLVGTEAAAKKRKRE